MSKNFPPNRKIWKREKEWERSSYIFFCFSSAKLEMKIANSIKHLISARHKSWCFKHYCCLVTRLCPTLCDPTDCSTPGFPVLHHLLEFAEIHVHWIGDAIQPSHPLSPPSPPTFNLSQHQGLFQWVCSSHQMAKVLEFQLQHQSFQWIFRTDFL